MKTLLLGWSTFVNYKSNLPLLPVKLETMLNLQTFTCITIAIKMPVPKYMLINLPSSQTRQFYSNTINLKPFEIISGLLIVTEG